MSSRCRISVIFGMLFLLAGPVSARTVTFCAEPDNLPFSNQDGTGFEIEIARVVTKALGADPAFIWISSRNMHGFLRKTLGRGMCDAIVGMPVGVEGVAETRPYYRTGWMFVSRSDGTRAIHSFDDLTLREFTVAVPEAGDGFDTAPAIALARRGLTAKLRLFPVNGPADAPDRATRMLDAVLAGNVDLAVAWGPVAGWYAARHPGLTLVPTPTRDGLGVAFTQAIAIAVPPRNLALRDALDEALDRERAAVRRILLAWHVPVLENTP
jgi:mxaJ protein